MPRPPGSPRNIPEYREALKAQRRWFMHRLVVAAVGFSLAVLFGGLSLHLANQAQNDAQAAAQRAKRTAEAVADQAAAFRKVNVTNDLRACVRANDARRGVRVNSLSLASLLDAVTPNQPDPPRSLFKSVRVDLKANIDRNRAVDCVSAVEGIELLRRSEIAQIIATRGRPATP